MAVVSVLNGYTELYTLQTVKITVLNRNTSAVGAWSKSSLSTDHETAHRRIFLELCELFGETEVLGSGVSYNTSILWSQSSSSSSTSSYNHYHHHHHHHHHHCIILFTHFFCLAKCPIVPNLKSLETAQPFQTKKQVQLWLIHRCCILLLECIVCYCRPLDCRFTWDSWLRGNAATRR